MLRGFIRRAALSGSIAAIALVLAPAAASAAPTASTITSPASGSYFYYDHNAVSGPLMTVTGTTSGGSGNVDIVCFDGDTDTFKLASNVTVTSGSFSSAIMTGALHPSGLNNGTCVLRAVPTGDVADYPPGSPSPFAGPTIAVSEKDAQVTGSDTFDYGYDLSDFAGFLGFQSAGRCGLYSWLYLPGTFVPSARSFDCVGALYDPDGKQTGGNFGGGIKIDGVEALDSQNADDAKAGYQGITLSDSFAGGALTIHDDEPILVCVPSYTTCTSYKSSGIELDRTWQSLDDGAAALQTDVFRSVDAAQHSVAVLEDDSIANPAGNPPGPGFMFPGSASFQDYAANATVAVPSGPGAVYFKTDSATPAAGDSAHPQGAITYANAPSGGPVDFSWAAVGNNDIEFVWPYNLTVPAGGSAALRFGYVEAYALADVQSLAQSTLTTAAISTPANGASFTSSSVTVTGTASDPTGIAKVTVNGVNATLDAAGAWSAQVPLTAGPNTITAVATDTYGVAVQAQETVTASLSGTASAGAYHVTSKGITFTVGCVGNAYAPCAGSVTLDTTESLKGKQVLAVTAAHGKPKRKHKSTVAVGKASYNAAGGATATVTAPLNAKGRALLAHFHKLPIKVTVSQTLTTGQVTTVSTKTATVKTPKPKKHKHHH